MNKEVKNLIDNFYGNIVNELYKEVETANISINKFFNLVESYNTYITKNKLDLPYLYDMRKTEEMRKLLNENVDVLFDDLAESYNNFMTSNNNNTNVYCSIVFINKENAVINNTYKAVLEIIGKLLKEIVKDVFINPQEKGYKRLYKNIFSNFFIEEE